VPGLPPDPPRTLRLRVDSVALAANWSVLNRLSGSAEAGAAIKADGYGLGVGKVLPALVEAGAREFFVAHWSEVAELLGDVAPEQISVLHGPLNAGDAAYAQATGVRPVINSLRQAKLWLDAGGRRCDLMIDTGINRLGLPPDEIGDPLIVQLEVDVLMSHLASADEDSALNSVQLGRFREVCAAIPARRRSLANSAGIALGPDYAFDLTRPGLALYGGVARPELAMQIQQVAFPEAAIIQVRELQPGDSVGYNATFTATRPMRAATVSLGYEDGFLRCWGARGWLEHEGAKLPLLGKVSMDMVVVDLAAAPGLKEGDWLALPYALPEAAELSGLSQYELLTLLGERFSR
jgi:alanine racemase